MYKKDFKQKYFLYCRDSVLKIEKFREKENRTKRIKIWEVEKQ